MIPKPQSCGVFEGYSSSEMKSMLYEFLEPKCPVQINLLAEEEYLEIPLFKQVKYLLQLIANKGELKLTKRGNLPVKIVADVYRQGFLKDYWIEKGYAKVYNEGRIVSILITRVLLELSPLIKKRHNKLSLTRKGVKIKESNQLLFQELYNVFTKKYRWGFLDRYNDDHLGQFGFVFSLLLLHKYGRTERSVDFYAEKYFRAFPGLMENSAEPPIYCYSAYTLRTFENFLEFYALVEISPRNYRESQKVKTTNLFHRVVKIREPGQGFFLKT